MPPSGPDQPHRASPPDLSVRQHERLECRLPGYAQIAPESAGAVRIARAAAQSEGISVTIVDCSAGGLGLRSEVFVPRACVLHVQAFVPGPDAAAGGGRAVEATVRVQRVAMLDRGPTYYIGASFCDLSEGQRSDVNWLMEALRRERGLSAPLALPPGRGTALPPGSSAGTGMGGSRRAV